MACFWTCHWRFHCWRPDINQEGCPVCSCGSNSFRKRGVSLGDIVYIISLREGHLYLGGRMLVKRIVSRPEAVRLLHTDNLYDAEEWVVDPEQTGTLLHLHRRLSPGLTRQLRFESKGGPRPPCFISDSELDNQATRGVRELTAESAALLDRIIEATDRLPRSNQVFVVTEDLLQEKGPPSLGEFRLPEEIPDGALHTEGSVRRVEVNRYERDPLARQISIAAHGTECCICGFSFEAAYGQEANDYIHVHHIRPLSDIGGEYVVDPERDFWPVCPNCHAVLHLGDRCRSIDEVRVLVARHKRKKEGTD